ncbi:MAG: CDP-glycerol glycerophosphotransferase family protein [Candidatus Sungiibacteriota bacterium]|uniref:CDP-glycerol glycerophosphotransferase family protein n=1 Tax=Candidatus Sungiibacteriota bacterium TaxID=2750080 RepID=A0A7T5RJX9_9BACT|nr:MAG: CDP-glycerol glycerophosphotransferase family protein [Candidatus Sungbacteria bacterium]
MKTICICVKNTKLIQRYFLRSGLLEKLVSSGNVKVVLLVEKGFEKQYQEEFEGERVRVMGVRVGTGRPSFLFRICVLVSENVLVNFAAVRHQIYRSVRRGKSWFLLIPRLLLWRLVGFIPSRLTQRLVRRVVAKISVSSSLSPLFQEIKPDLVFATSLTEWTFDVPILLAARSYGATTAASVRMWTNLGPTSFLLFHPDHLILQNEFLKDMAVRFNFFPKNRIHVTGFPYFDWFKTDQSLPSREEFCRALGIDPRKRCILYADSGIGDLGRDLAFVELFGKLVQNGRLPKDLVMIFRPQPYYAGAAEALKELRSRRFDSVVVDFVNTTNLKYPDPTIDRGNINSFINAMRYSEMLITPGGAILLEAAVFKKPMVVTAFDAAPDVPYWKSFARFYDGTAFYWTDLITTGGVRAVSSPKEFERTISKYLKNPSLDEKGRECLRSRFLGPQDGRATELLAQVLLSLERA